MNEPSLHCKDYESLETLTSFEIQLTQELQGPLCSISNKHMMSLQSKSGVQTLSEPEPRIEVTTSYPPFLCPGRKFTQQPRTYEERNLIPFCCSEITARRELQTKEENDLFHFISVMTNLDSIPSAGILPPELSYFLSGNIQLIKCEQMISGKLSSMRYFMPHPNRINAYAEIGEEAVIKSMKDTKGRWIAFAGLRFLKAACQYHPEEGLWFYTFLRREEEVKAEEAVAMEKANEFLEIRQKREVKMMEDGLSL
jgi:hypothetical protein